MIVVLFRFWRQLFCVVFVWVVFGGVIGVFRVVIVCMESIVQRVRGLFIVFRRWMFRCVVQGFVYRLKVWQVFIWCLWVGRVIWFYVCGIFSIFEVCLFFFIVGWSCLENFGGCWLFWRRQQGIWVLFIVRFISFIFLCFSGSFQCLFMLFRVRFRGWIMFMFFM